MEIEKEHAAAARGASSKEKVDLVSKLNGALQRITNDSEDRRRDLLKSVLTGTLVDAGVEKKIAKSCAEKLRGVLSMGCHKLCAAAKAGDPNNLESVFTEIRTEASKCVEPCQSRAAQEKITSIKWLVTALSNHCLVEVGEDPFHTAVMRKHFDAADRLLKLGWSIDSACRGEVTALHHAVVEGDHQTVQWLCDRNARVDCQAEIRSPQILCQSLMTPLHCAAFKLDLESLKILCECKQVTKEMLMMKNQDTRTILHFAQLNARQRDHEMIAYLCKKEPDLIRETDRSGQFSIHYATQRNHVTAIELYSGACRTNDERAAVLNCQDKDGRTPLHVAVQSKKLEAVTALCTLGADLYVNDKGEDPRRNPRTPLDCARAQNPHSAISQYLEQAVNRVDLLLDALSLETNDVKIVKLLVCGDPEMGKTQFCRSLIRPPHFWSQNIYRLFGRATSLFNPSQRTPGINVENINIPGVGLMSMWDFAGHMQYYVSHSLFLGSVNAVFCVVTSLQKLRTEQEEYLRFWLEFIILARRSSNILAKENRRPVVIIIASHSDAPDRDRPLRGRQLREHLDIKQRALQRALQRLRGEFAAELTIVNDLFCMDCRDATCPEMSRLRQCLAQYRDEVLKNLKPAPMLARQILERMPMWRKEMDVENRLPLLTYDEFTNNVRHVNPQADNHVISIVTKYLHHCGEVIQVEKQEGRLSIPWLVFLMPVHLCRDLIGRFLSPAEFKIDRIEVDPTGCVLKATAIDIFKRYWTNVGDVIPVFEQLGLCYYTDKEETMLCIPALVTMTKMPHDAWDKLGPNAICAGRRFEYTRKASIFAYGQLSRLIVQLHKQHNLLNIPVWSTGLTFRTGRNVQVMIRLMPNSKGIDLVVQAPPSEYGEDNAYEAAIQLEHIAEEIEGFMTEFRQEYDNKSYDVFVPSVAELKKNGGLRCDRFFPMAEVWKALFTPLGTVDARGQTPESAVNLLFCGQSELIELPPAPQYEECSLRMLPHPVEEVVLKEFDPMSALFKDWRMMAGEALGLRPHQIDRLFRDHATGQSTTAKLMSIWAQRGGLIKDLLKFLHKYGKDYTAELVQIGLDAYVRAGGRGHGAAQAASRSLERSRGNPIDRIGSIGSPDPDLLASGHDSWGLSSDRDSCDVDGQVLSPESFMSMSDPHPPSPPPSSIVFVTNSGPDTQSSMFSQMDSRTVNTDGTSIVESRISLLPDSLDSEVMQQSTGKDSTTLTNGDLLKSRGRPLGMALDSSAADSLTEHAIQIVSQCASDCWLDIGRILIGHTQDVHSLILRRSMGLFARDSNKLYWIIDEWHRNNGQHATLMRLLHVLGTVGKRELVEHELSRRGSGH